METRLLEMTVARQCIGERLPRLTNARPGQARQPTAMRNRYSAVVQRDGKWFIAFCPEVPEANGQGKTREECLQSLAAAIELVVDYKRERGLENAPKGAEQTSVLV